MTAMLPVGYRRNGKPIWPIRGAEDPPATLEDAIRRLESLRSDLVTERARRQNAETREQEQKTLVLTVTGERDQARQQLAAQPDVEQRLATARAEGHQAGKAAADAEWQPKLVNQTAALVATKARQAAIDAGIRPEQTPPEGAPDRVGRFLALVDMAGVTGDDGAIKADELATRVKNAATANPEFVTASSAGGGASTYSAASGSGQGATGASPEQLGAKVDAALAQMHQTLRLPAPTAQGT